MHNTPMATVAIVGASGYAGQETLDRVLTHPALDLYALGECDDAGRQVVGDEGLGRTGDDDLAAMPCGGDPCRAADFEAAIVVTREMRLPAVEAHPDADPGVGRPFGAGQGALGLDGRPDARAGLRKGGEDRVALGPDDDPALPVDGGMLERTSPQA